MISPSFLSSIIDSNVSVLFSKAGSTQKSVLGTLLVLNQVLACTIINVIFHVQCFPIKFGRKILLKKLFVNFLYLIQTNVRFFCSTWILVKSSGRIRERHSPVMSQSISVVVPPLTSEAAVKSPTIYQVFCSVPDYISLEISYVCFTADNFQSYRVVLTLSANVQAYVKLARVSVAKTLLMENCAHEGNCASGFPLWLSICHAVGAC